jgi:hypothetical protein
MLHEGKHPHLGSQQEIIGHSNAQARNNTNWQDTLQLQQSRTIHQSLSRVHKTVLRPAHHAHRLLVPACQLAHPIGYFITPW